MKNYCIQTNRERKSARYDYILHQNCKTYCKTQKIVSADCSVFMGIPADFWYLSIGATPGTFLF